MSNLKEVILTRRDLDSLDSASFSNSKLRISNSRGNRVALPGVELDNCVIEVMEGNESIILRDCTGSLVTIYSTNLKTIYIKNCVIDSINIITAPEVDTSVLRYVELLDSKVLNLEIDTSVDSEVEDFSIFTSTKNTIGNLRVINRSKDSSSTNLNLETSGISLRVAPQDEGVEEDTIHNSSLISKIYIENFNLSQLANKRNTFYVSEIVLGPRVTIGTNSRLIPPSVFKLQTAKEVSPTFLSDMYRYLSITVAIQYSDNIVASYGIDKIFPNPLPLFTSFYTALRTIFLDETVMADVNHPRVSSELDVKNTCEVILGQMTKEVLLASNDSFLKDFKKSLSDKYVSTLEVSEVFDHRLFDILLNEIIRDIKTQNVFGSNITRHMKRLSIFVTDDGENYIFYKI